VVDTIVINPNTKKIITVWLYSQTFLFMYLATLLLLSFCCVTHFNALLNAQQFED